MADKNQVFRLGAKVASLSASKGEVMIYSYIYDFKFGDWDPTVTSNDFDKQLKALGDVDELTIRINSPGGMVTEAIAIRTTLMKYKAKKTIDIEGCCDSAATLIACLPGARVRMAKGSEYMIHRCSAGARGNADKMLSTYNSMVKTDTDMAEIYAERTGKTVDECMELMKAETWFSAQEAVDAGFVDEVLTPEEEEPIVACAVTEETMALMRSLYAHTPDRPIRAERAETKQTGGAPEPPVSIGNREDALQGPTENKDEGVTQMPDIKTATAEELERENPALAQSIAEQARTAERERMKQIDDLTPGGAEYAQMAKDAKANGTSAQDFFKQILAKQRKSGEEYMAKRQKETAHADKIGGGDPGDFDDPEAMADKAAKEIAELAKTMSANSYEMC